MSKKNGHFKLTFMLLILMHRIEADKLVAFQLTVCSFKLTLSNRSIFLPLIHAHRDSFGSWSIRILFMRIPTWSA